MTVTNFESITYDLTAIEREYLPIMIEGFKKHIGKEKAIKAPDIIANLDKRKGIKLTEARLRKLVNYIRCTSSLPLIATSNGYYITDNKEEILKECQSLQDRANAILGAREGLLKFTT